MAAESSKMNAGAAQDDPEAIRAEIQQTRDDMTETISAIQEKLNPQRIREEAIGSVRRATIGRVEDAADDVTWKVKGAGNDVFETVKHNPAPAVLAAVGLGWLFMESRNRSGNRDMRRFSEDRRSRDRYYADERYGRGGYDYGYSYDEYGRRSIGSGEPGFRDYERQGQGIRDRAGEAVSQAGSKVQDVASQATGAVQSAAESAKDTAGQVVDSARYGAQQVAQEAQYRAERVGSRFGEMLQDNPLVIGAAAAALGAIVGFAFPTTDKENEIIGPARDRVMDRAQEVASETADKVQQVAKEATSAAKDAAKNEAQKQNLTTGSNPTTG